MIDVELNEDLRGRHYSLMRIANDGRPVRLGGG